MDKDYKKQLEGKTILITGGTGSFGSTMANFLVELNPEEIIIFSRDELKQFEMRNAVNKSKLFKFFIGDVKDFDTVDRVMEGVDYVFSAAALKQVPSAEFFPMEAVKTNIIGGYNVMKAALRHKVKTTVVLSTDKAVYPINAMGMSKALLEKTMIALANEDAVSGKTILCGTRYGNVIYSRGSVIPGFVAAIKNGKKLSVTDPSMTRFLLPLRDSVRLVLHALSEGKNGSMYIKKAPAADIQTLAEAVCEIFEYNKGIEIVGIRAGEKMHETLVSKEEWRRVVDQGDFYEIPPETRAFEYERFYLKGKKDRRMLKEGYTSENTQRLTLAQTKELLLSLPEIQQELKDYHGK